MQVQVAAAAGCLPAGCYVGVRVGEVMKQGRYNPEQNYRFPRQERHRNAKIDIYRHVGSCCVGVDPEIKTNSEVKLSTMDPDMKDLTLKVCTKPDNAKQVEPPSKEDREDRARDVKQKAVDYMSKHCIEERLGEAMKLVLRKQPADPIEFICRHLMGVEYDNLMARPPVSPPAHAAPAAADAKATKRPFCTRPSVGTWLMTGPPEQSAAELAAAEEPFDTKPSVGTWRMPASVRQKRGVSAEASAALAGAKQVLVEQSSARRAFNIGEGFRIPGIASKDELQEVERVVSSALQELTGELEGEYYPLGHLSGSAGTDTQLGGGCGVYETGCRDVRVLVNQGATHVELVAKQRRTDVDLTAAQERLGRLEDSLRLALRQDGYEIV